MKCKKCGYDTDLLSHDEVCGIICPERPSPNWALWALWIVAGIIGMIVALDHLSLPTL